MKGEAMWMTWSVLVVNLIPGYSISSEIWAICLYIWSYQRPTGIKRSALCWLLDQCMNTRSYLRLWQLWTQGELSLCFHLLKRGHIQVGWDGKEALCADTRQTSTHSWYFHPVTVFFCVCFASQTWGWRKDKGEVYVWEQSSFVAPTRVLTPRHTVHGVWVTLFRHNIVQSTKACQRNRQGNKEATIQLFFI